MTPLVSPDRIRVLIEAGHTDTSIAAAHGVDRKTVGRIRRRFGIPATTFQVENPEFVEMVGRLARAGLADEAIALSTGRNLKAVRYRRLKLGILREHRPGAIAQRFGLPPHLSGSSVRVLVALALGASTRKVLSQRLGIGGSVGLTLRRLVSLGLVAAVRPPDRRRPWTYVLTLTALDRLASAGKDGAA